MKGDLMDPASVAAAVQGADVVVFAAGVASMSQAARQKTVIYSQGGWTSSLQDVSSTVIAGTQRGCFAVYRCIIRSC
jgi:putative NADH-flavin reductase